MASSVALILAKGESKRLPNKNVLIFNGKPLFIWNVEKCLRIFGGGNVYVSSDSKRILEIAEDAGAIPIKRDKDLCGDTPNIPVYQHAYSYMKMPAFIMAVQANSPSVSSDLIILIKILMDKWGMQEIMTCHDDYSIYGSVWALTKERLLCYDNFYKPKPDILIRDNSIDIHTQEDFNNAQKQFYASRNNSRNWT